MFATSVEGLIVKQIEPGSECPYMLIIIDEKGGAGKGRFCSMLAKPFGAKQSGVNIRNSEFKEKVMEKSSRDEGLAIIELGELNKYSDQDVENLKELITDPELFERVKFNKNPLKAYRITFQTIGTTNSNDFSIDRADRRWLKARLQYGKPIDNERFSKEFYERIMVWVYQRFKTGEYNDTEAKYGFSVNLPPHLWDACLRLSEDLIPKLPEQEETKDLIINSTLALLTGAANQVGNQFMIDQNTTNVTAFNEVRRDNNLTLKTRAFKKLMDRLGFTSKGDERVTVKIGGVSVQIRLYVRKEPITAEQFFELHGMPEQIPNIILKYQTKKEETNGNA